jgi:hypothetical protein
LALPNRGQAVADCVEYPYLDTLREYPGDYAWMPFAILLVLGYLALMATIHATASPEKQVFSLLGLAVATLAALTLVSDYWIQFAVVPASLMKGETEGIALLTQYNPHGIFIALEELGYLLMSLSFLGMAPVFAGGKGRLERRCWIFGLGLGPTMVAPAVISLMYGLSGRTEIAVISIDWLVLLINGVLLALVFRKKLLAVGGRGQ